MLDLTRLLANQTDFMDTVAALQEGQGASIDGVWGSSCALVSAAVSSQGFPVNLIVLPRGKQIDDFVDDLTGCSGRIGYERRRRKRQKTKNT